MTTDNHDSDALRKRYDGACTDHNNAAAALIQTLATNLTHITEDAIARVEALEAELAEARAELDEFEPIDDVEVAIHAQQVLDDLHRRDLYHHPNDEPVTAEAALEALRTVLDGVDAVFGRVADVGGPVEVSDKYGWYRNDDLRAQVAALTAERDRLRALVREQVSCECSNDDACRFVRERDEARAERDRLARVLACEVGDAEHASDGWQRDVHHRWSRRSPDFYLVAFKWGGTHTWEAWDNPDGTLICHGRAKYALDAMEAADEAARAGEAS